MELNKIIAALEHPEQALTIEETDLRELLKAYPFFKEGQMLLAKLMHERKHLHYNKQLKVAAVHANSRRSLYNLIYQSQLKEAIHSSEKATNEPDISQEPTEAEQIESSESADRMEQPIPLTSIGRNPKPEEESVAPEFEESPTATNTDEPPAELRDLGALEKEILSHAFHLSSEANYVTTKRNDEEENDLEEETDPTEKEEPKGFGDWLARINATQKPKPKQPRKIIDEFIAKEPQISRPEKAEFFSPVNAARMSIIDNENFVTETLASIYAKQGNVSKAKSIYEKLMLKYPDKKAYFARCIKKLEN